MHCIERTGGERRGGMERGGKDEKDFDYISLLHCIHVP